MLHHPSNDLPLAQAAIRPQHTRHSTNSSSSISTVSDAEPGWRRKQGFRSVRWAALCRDSLPRRRRNPRRLERGGPAPHGSQTPATPISAKRPCAGNQIPGYFWSLAFAMRRVHFESVGGFNESFIGYGAEDTDFAFRATCSGLDLAFLGGRVPSISTTRSTIHLCSISATSLGMRSAFITFTSNGRCKAGLMPSPQWA